MPQGASAELTQLLALAAALGWASGLRLYAVLFLTGLAGHLGWVQLPHGLLILQSPLLLWGSGALLAIEFVADKIPWVDSVWDALHTLIRIPAGAALAYQLLGGAADAQGLALLLGLMGGSLAALAHAAKATTRVVVNHSPEPFSNLALSLAGDLAVPGLLWLAWTHPLAALALLLLGLLLAIWLIRRGWGLLHGLWIRLGAARSA